LFLLMTLAAPPAHAQSVELPLQPEPPIQLVAAAGRSMHIALDQRMSVKRVGQPVTATLLDALYVYDRMVVPVGAKVFGHVDAIENGARRLRTRAILAGDFTPPRKVRLRFDTLVLSDGRKILIEA
jgi:hypothetical protein